MINIASSNPITKSHTPLSVWELPSLLTPLHIYKRSKKKNKPKKERTHFPAVLGFVFRNRFAVASQIQRRFSHILRSDRTARRHLEELESLGYLAVAPARGVSPNFPKVFYVTGRGVKKIQQSYAAQGKSWEAFHIDRRGRDSQEGYSADHILHEILTTEFLLAVWQTVEGRPDLELLTIQRRSLAKHSAFRLTIGSRRTRLIPDAMFLFRQADNGLICCFLEMDTGTMNKKQITRKYQHYWAWSQSETGKQFLIELYKKHGAIEPRPVFRLLMVASDRTGQNDRHRMRELYEPVQKLPTVMQNRLWFTTVVELQNLQTDLLPLESPIWRRQDKSKNKKGITPNSQFLTLFPSR